MIETTWAEFKNFVDSRVLKIHYLDGGEGSHYRLFSFDGPMHITCDVDHAEAGTEGADQSDFETNYKDGANPSFTDDNNRQIVNFAPLGSTEGLYFNGKVVTGTALAGTSTTFSKKMDYEVLINGVQVFLQNQEFDDSIHFQVVDKEYLYAGIKYPAEPAEGVTWAQVAPDGVVLLRFAEDWSVDCENSNQDAVKTEYPAKLSAGLYVEIIYNSTGASDVPFRCNLFLHKPSI